MRYRRATTPGGTYFFTVVTDQRQKVFHDPAMVTHLRSAFHSVKIHHPFTIDAIVVLTDHLHCIWTLPSGDADFSTRWRLIKTYFTRSCPERYKRDRNGSRLRKRNKPLGNADSGNTKFEMSETLKSMLIIFITILSIINV